jgi:hypothetical protein
MRGGGFTACDEMMSGDHDGNGIRWVVSSRRP